MEERTFIIMSHGNWPIKQVKTNKYGTPYDTLEPSLNIKMKGWGEDEYTYRIVPEEKPVDNLSEIFYTLPKNTSLVTTTGQNTFALACQKYDDIIKTSITNHGIDLFKSHDCRNRYNFLSQSRLYSQFNTIIDLRISFDDDRSQWNIWEIVDKNLVSVDMDYQKVYKLSEIIERLTNPPNIYTNIILHCCMPAISNDRHNWNDTDLTYINTHITNMMKLGDTNIRNILRVKPSNILCGVKTRHGNVPTYNQTDKSFPQRRLSLRNRDVYSILHRQSTKSKASNKSKASKAPNKSKASKAPNKSKASKKKKTANTKGCTWIKTLNKWFCDYGMMR